MSNLHFEGFTLDLARRQLRQGESVLPLPGKAFDLLVYLAKNPGKPLPKAALISHVWPDSFVEDANLSQTVFVIRKVLGPDYDRLVVTLPRVGYQFSAHVEERSDRSAVQDIVQADSTAVSHEEISTETKISRVVYEEETEERVPFYRSPLVLGLCAFAIVLLTVAGWLGWQRWEDRVGGPPVQVVIADADGSTGDPVLDRTLGTVFRMELAQSPFVTILSGANVKAKMVQMEHKADDPLTAALAREVCERSGSQAVVHGSVAKSGSHYILTEEATNCVDGASLGEASRDVSSPDKLPEALAKLAGKIRHDLGESRRTIARFNHPLSSATTGSLDALKNLTEAERLIALGRASESVDLLKQAVAIDPNFAAAWLDLSTYALNNRQAAEGREYLTKAYSLREYATEPSRRYIVARYNGLVTGDLYESLRNYQTWVDEYPTNATAWSGMTVTNHDLGRTLDELNSAQRTINLSANYQVVYVALGETQLRAGVFGAARATFQTAITKGFDGDMVRTGLLKCGHILHDPALIAEQEAWSREHPFSPFVLAHMALYAEIEGRRAEAARLLPAALDASRHLGQEELLNDIIAEMLVDTAGLGHLKEARELLATLKLDPADPFHLYALEYAGEGDKVEALLKAQLTAHPHSTKWNESDGPILRGKLLLDGQKPREALTILAPTRAFDGKDIDAIYLRGLANLQLKQLQEAEIEFRKIIDHPGIDATAHQRPLALLQLARTLAQEGRKPAAAEAYRAFLTLWAHADPDQPLLLAARKEFEAVERGN